MQLIFFWICSKLYLGITLAICIVVAFLITFFLLPRSVTIDVVDLDSTHIYIPENQKDIPYIDVAVSFYCILCIRFFLLCNTR